MRNPCLDLPEPRTAMSEVRRLQAENTKLRLIHQEEMFNAIQTNERPLVNDLVKLRAENAKLREALERISACDPLKETAALIANKALGGG
jgi:hypothetical protein